MSIRSDHATTSRQANDIPILLFQTDGGAVKVETDDPKTISKFTDKYSANSTVEPLAVPFNIFGPVEIHGSHTFFYSVYKGASRDHVITNVAGGKTVTLKKKNFPDTGVKRRHFIRCKWY